MKNIYFTWKPGKDLLALAVSYIAVVGFLASATFIATASNGILYFLLYGVGAAAIAGIGFPVIWTTVVRKRPVSDLGISKQHWKKSLLLQAIFILPQLPKVIESVSSKEIGTILPLAAMALAIGFFEAVFWRGWALQILERAFGMVPAVILGAALYALYHIGYGMDFNEMAFLFFIGMVFAVAFLFTRNILILWPLFQPSGQLITLVEDGLSLPVIASLGFVEVLAFMILVVVLAERRFRKVEKK